MTTAATETVLFAWSSGKDSALALYELRQSDRWEVTALLTTVTEGYERVSMHGVREALLDEQAAAMGLALHKVRIPIGSSMDEYETRMRAMLEQFAAEGVATVAFGDIFLEDLRKQREAKLSRADMKGLFPIWKRDTSVLARQFIDLGFKAVITCVDTQMLDGAFAGSDYDEGLLDRLPASVDPCGENGEFHTFVYDGPLFERPVAVRKGEVVLRDNRFSFCDLLPAEAIAE